MESNLDEISCLITKFFHLFIVESRFLEAFEFDNFIVRNVKIIAAWYVGKVSTIARAVFKHFPQVYGRRMTYRETTLRLSGRSFSFAIY